MAGVFAQSPMARVGEKPRPSVFQHAKSASADVAVDHFTPSSRPLHFTSPPTKVSAKVVAQLPHPIWTARAIRAQLRPDQGSHYPCLHRRLRCADARC